MTETNPLSATDLDDDAVADYLRRHPDFLIRHPDVLAGLHVPHRTGGGVVSLIERQVEVLRSQNEALEQRLAELLRTARENERVGARLLGLGRGLLEADSLDAVLAFVRDALINEFTADFVWIRLIDEPAGTRAARSAERFLRADAPELAPFNTCLENGQPVCGGFDHERIAALCASDGSDLGSAAVVPLTAGRPIGIVVLGSRDPRHFHAAMGTHFLAQLGELVTTGVTRHLDGD